MRRALICTGELSAGWEAIGPSPVLFPDKARGPDVALAPGRPSLWPKALARLGWCSRRQELVVSPPVGIPGVGPAAAALTGQETGAERGYPGGGGKGVSWGRWRSRPCRHPHGISSREDCGGGVSSPEPPEDRELPGGREGASLAGPSLGPAPGGRSPGHTPAPRAPAPPQPRRRGPGRCSEESTFAGVAESSVPCRLPLQRSVAVGPRSRASVLQCLEAGGTWAHTEPCHPRPLLRRAPRRGRAAAWPRSRGKRDLGGRPHPRAQSPAPGASHSPCWRRSAPLAGCNSLARIRTPPGTGSGRDCEAARSGRAAEAGENAAGRASGRAAAGAGLAREGRAPRRSLACPRGGGKTRPDSPARRQPRARPGPRMWGAGTGGNPRPPRANLSPARARRASPAAARRGATRPSRPSPLPAAPRAAAARCAARGSPAGRQPPASPTSPEGALPAPLLLLLVSPAPLRFQNSAAPGEARSVHHLPDPRRLLLGEHYYPC